MTTSINRSRLSTGAACRPKTAEKARQRLSLSMENFSKLKRLSPRRRPGPNFVFVMRADGNWIPAFAGTTWFLEISNPIEHAQGLVAARK